MSKIKALVTAIALLTVTSGAFAYYNFIGTAPLPGKSIASVDLQNNTMFSVFSFGLRIATKDCFDIAITDTKVSKPKKNGSWEEIWTLKACERTGWIPITFTETADGSGNFAIDYMNVKWK